MTATIPLSEMDRRKLLRIVSLVGDHVLALISADQLLSLRDVVSLSCGQYESQGIAKTVHAHVDLGAEPASASAERLRRLAPFFRALPQRTGEPERPYCL